MKSLLLSLTLVFLSAPFLFSQPGAVDSTFGTKGLSILNLGHGYTPAYATMSDIADNGKILLGGQVYYSALMLARYTPDGEKDTTFGIDGVVITSGFNAVKIKALHNDKTLLLSPDGLQVKRLNANGSQDLSFQTEAISGAVYLQASSADMYVQADGKILVTGFKYDGQFYHSYLVRYLENGALDTYFGQNGLVTVDSISIYFPNSMDVDADDKILVLVSAGMSKFAVVRYLPDGTPDAGFGNAGLAVWENAAGADTAVYGCKVLAQPDGKILAAATLSGSDIQQSTLFRMDATGKPDSSFGENGAILALVTSTASDLGLQADGKILLGGFYYDAIYIQRYLPDGAPDDTYLGTQSFDYVSSGYNQMLDFSVQADGKLILALPDFHLISIPVAGYYNFQGFRLLENGAPDLGFDFDGKLTASPDLGNDYAKDVAVQPDGKMLVGGVNNSNVFDYNTYILSKHPVLVRFNANGTYDIPFPIYSVFPGFTPSNYYTFYCVTVQPDGKILAAVYYNNSVQIIRFLNDGTPDASFGVNAVVALPDFYNVADVAVQPDGKILVGGDYYYTFVVQRLTPAGAIDGSFGTNGLTTIPVGPGNIQVHCTGFSLLNDGKMLLSGDASAGDAAIVCINANGQLNTGFSGDGIATFLMGSCKSMVVQADGKIILGGSDTAEPNDGNFKIMRVLADGSELDAGFGGNGIVSFNTANTYSFCKSMALQPDNKIICTGTSTQPGGPVNLMLVRLKPDGNFDTSFGNDGISLSNAGVQSKDGGGVALQPSGKIVVAGNFSHETETSIGLMRFQSGLVVGTAEQASPKMALMAFPTLFSEALYLDFSALPAPVKSFAVFDGSGRLIYLDQHGAAGKLNIGEAGNWMPGIYVLQATTEHGVFVQKIMKH